MESSEKWRMKDGILKPGRENVEAEVEMKSEWVWEWQSEAEALFSIRGRAEVCTWPVRWYSAALDSLNSVFYFYKSNQTAPSGLSLIKITDSPDENVTFLNLKNIKDDTLISQKLISEMVYALTTFQSCSDFNTFVGVRLKREIMKYVYCTIETKNSSTDIFNSAVHFDAK